MKKTMDALTPLVSENLAQMAFERLEKAILTGDIEPGFKMSEADLARRLGISRGPLREAIGRLEGLGLVTRVANQGPRVIALTKTELVELLVFREAVEGMAARQAAIHVTPQEITALQRLLDKHERAPEVQAGTGYFQGSGDMDFHLQIASSSRNARLHAFVNGPLYSTIRMYRRRLSSIPGRPLEALAEHHAILDAIKANDPDAAEHAMRQHISRGRENVMRALPDDENEGAAEKARR
jgi:DNA-binding GntR family transcriptional regulator